MMPETAVGKDDALVRVDDEIRTPGKRGILNPEFKPGGGQKARDPFFNRGITRADGTHVFTARGLVVNVRHRRPRSDEAERPC